MGHTPGPWKVDREPVDGCCHVCSVKDKNGEHVADIGDKKDAALIASAPELLEACYMALGRLRSVYEIFSDSRFTDRHGDAQKTQEVIKAIETLMAKAEGR